VGAVELWKVSGGLGFALAFGWVDLVLIIGFAVGGLCQFFGSFFSFEMSSLGEILQVQGLDNFGD
jgi:hypothetical protein